MPNIRSAKKALRSASRKRIFNDRRRKAMRESIKDVKKAVKTKVKDSKEVLSKAYQAIDKAMKAGVLKKNTAARRKSVIARMASKSDK